MSKDLYRKESIEAKKTKWMGNVILVNPFPLKFLIFISVIIGIILIIFITQCSYTKRTTVKGQLTIEDGFVKIYAMENGVISNIYVKEGEKVKKGQVLSVVTNIQSSLNDNLYSEIVKQSKLKEQLIVSEIKETKNVQKNELKSTQNNIKILENSIKNTNLLIINQEQKIRVSKRVLDRYYEISKENAVSKNEIEERYLSFLSQKSQLEAFKRELLNDTQKLNEEKSILNSLAHNHHNQIYQLNRLLSTNSQELLEYNTKQSQIIRSNVDGVVTNINFNVGQSIEINKPIISIAPINTLLIAQLYVPSKAIGFIEQHSPILLRYEGYPYQKFGSAKGTIIAIPNVALAKQDLPTIGTIYSNEQTNNEPIYLIKVKLEQQFIKIYGKNKKLEMGMLLEADIMQERRKIYEWALEPIYSISGKI